MEYYFQDFELLEAQATSMPKKQLMGYFLARLRQNICNQVHPYDPQSLIWVVEISCDVDIVLKKRA